MDKGFFKRLFMNESMRKKSSNPYIPPHPIGHGHDYSWRASVSARKRASRSNRRKAARNHKGRR